MSCRISFRAAAALLFCGAAAAAQSLVAYRVTGDAIAEPLTAEAGNPQRGREVVLNRSEGGCLLCHALPERGDERARFMGDLGPPLAGVGSRLSPGQLRLRLVDSMRVNPNTVMPAYYRIEGLNQVASAFRGKPILSAQQVEDAVAYLATLKDSPK